jgi:hypothetical protein
VTVRVVAFDGVTPVSGATIAWSTTNGATLAVCGGTSSCSVLTDESGIASTGVTPWAVGAATITATLAPGVYSPPQQQSGTLVGVAASPGIGVANPYLWIAQGASVSSPIKARVVNSAGAGQSGTTVNFAVAQGSGSLSATSAVTDATGSVSVTLTVTNFATNVQVTACVAPADAPCATVYGSAVPPPALLLQTVAGSEQVIQGRTFQPLIARVTDSQNPPDPVLGASVMFQATVIRPIPDDPIVAPGDPIITNPGMPVILSLTQTSVQTDSNGLASIVPSVGSSTGPLEIEFLLTAGPNAMLQFEMETFPESGGDSSSGSTDSSKSGEIVPPPRLPRPPGSYE